MGTTERAQRFWDRAAESYDRSSAFLEERMLGAGRRWATARARGDILDVGVGTGANLALLPADAHVTGVDQSRAMLDQAGRRARELGRPVTLVRGDAGALALPDASFDTVLVTYVLCCVPDERRALAEAARVLRPGGRLLLADHVPSTNPGVRLGQHALDLVTSRLNGERLVRRPAAVVGAMPGLEIVAQRREGLGIVEAIEARRVGA